MIFGAGKKNQFSGVIIFKLYAFDVIPNECDETNTSKRLFLYGFDVRFVKKSFRKNFLERFFYKIFFNVTIFL